MLDPDSMKPDPQHWPQHDRPEIKLGEVLTADENAGESGNSEPLQQDALTNRNTQKGAPFVYITSKDYDVYVCIGLPSGTEIQKNMKDRSIQWEKALMEVLGFIKRGSYNYGSDTETHNMRQHFSPWDFAINVQRTQQVWDSNSNPGTATLNVFGVIQCFQIKEEKTYWRHGEV